MTDSKNDVIVTVVILQECTAIETRLCPDACKYLHALISMTLTEVMGAGGCGTTANPGQSEGN